MLRAYTSADAASVVALYGRAHAGDRSVNAVDLAQWNAIVAYAHNRDGRDFRVVERDAAVIAILSSAWLDDARVAGGIRQFRAVVDPAHRRQGLGRQLLREAERYAVHESAGVLQCGVRRDATAGRAMLERHGFTIAFRDLFLGCDARAQRPRANAPAGVTLRPYAGESDAPHWAAMANEGFARDAASVVESALSVMSYARAKGFALWVAERDGAPIGYCHTAQGNDGVGEIQGLVVRAAHEGQGVGAALLTCALDAMGARGDARIELVTESNNARAIRLYERFGFAAFDEFVTYRRRVNTGG